MQHTSRAMLTRTLKSLEPLSTLNIRHTELRGSLLPLVTGMTSTIQRPLLRIRTRWLLALDIESLVISMIF